MKKISLVILIVILALSTFFFGGLKNGERRFDIFAFFPLETGDKYIYDHSEGGERDTVSVTVKNVQSRRGEKTFNFFWQGKYNDRIQSLKLSKEGLIILANRHLVGQVPLKVIRTFLPPVVMIPSCTKRFMKFRTVQPIYDLDGKLIERENISGEICFVGVEHVNLPAGDFRCLHFFSRHNYKDRKRNSIHMHTYNFWVAPGIGIVKAIHSFVPFVYINYIGPGQKTIMNRYSGFFFEVMELKKAYIGGKVIGP